MLAPAKINMCLFLGGTRADGRHELISVMQSLAWGDELTAEAADRDEVICPGVDGPNLAAAALAAVPDGRPPLRITIEKRIPVAAGLGGGSADAAATLRLAREAAAADAPPAASDGRSDRPLVSFSPPTPELLAVAASLGADVPAQLEPGRSLATGAGEIVEPLAPPPRFGVLVLPSEHQLSTADVYREADRLELSHSPVEFAAHLDAVRSGLEEGGPFGLPLDLMVNDLEPAALHLQPAIAGELDRVRAAGADHVMVSGSGPTVLGFFVDPDDARAAAEQLPGAIATTPLDS